MDGSTGFSILGVLGVTTTVVLPIILIASVGFIVRRTLAVDPRSVTRVSLYAFLPALIFNSLSTTTIGGDEIGRIVLFAFLLTALLVGFGLGASRCLRLGATATSGLTISVAFMNTNNYGLPAVLFAFGQEGFDRAVIFAALSAVMTFTLAVFIAARGKMSGRAALISVFQIPVVWAVVLAFVVRALGVELPVPLRSAISLLANGAIPTIILLLGMQVAGMRARRIGLPVLTAVAGRLFVSPAIGMILAAALAPAPLTAKVLILEAAMPTAVNIALLASEYDAEPDLVSSVTLLTTIVSVVTVTGWVLYLQSL